ncbi:MAG: carboxypeptidase M32 [Proteobacteria bacterium]|nr:carboxypeptidase M32 [Pseudomonadota bacterium]
MKAYQELSQRFRRLGLLGDALAVLGWDTAAMMPDGGAPARAEQSATVSVLIHELLTAPRVGELLAAAEAERALDDWQRANLAEMRRSHRHATAVPAALVERLSVAASECEMAWRSARPANDFTGLLPKLRQVLALTREQAEAKAAAFGCAPYDALLDQYEPGGRAAAIDTLFGELEGFLPALTQRVLEQQRRQPAPLPLEGPFDVGAQRALGLKLMTALGFDFAHGRLDVSHHPFCGGTPDDVRITTRFDPEDFTSAMMGVLHETGHALYERGLPAAWRNQPVGSARGMSIHESQSLLVEMQACRSDAFARFCAPLARAAFGRAGPAWQPDNLHRLSTRVEPGLIRVDADEVTYPAHVILRYRLERALLAGDLDLAELPGAWRDGMQALLGIVPPGDTDGCLQDIHWPSGAWGYFPTYTLGAMTAAQLFAAACDQLPGLIDDFARGDFSRLLGWLRTNVHEKGSRHSAEEILVQATGRPLGVAAFRRHLEARYLEPVLA